MDDPYCKAHHCPRTECRPVDTHPESIRVSDALWEAVTRKAEAERTYRNDGIVQALAALLALPPEPLAAAAEKGLGPRKTRGFRVTAAQWDELTTWAAKAGTEPSSAVNAAILAWAMPEYAEALRGAAEIAAAAAGTPKPAARTEKPPAVRTEPPAPAPANRPKTRVRTHESAPGTSLPSKPRVRPIPAPREGKAPKVAAAVQAARAAGHNVTTASKLAAVPAAPVFKAGPLVDCPHENFRGVKGVCPDCLQWVGGKR